eukprot:515430_1
MNDIINNIKNFFFFFFIIFKFLPSMVSTPIMYFAHIIIATTLFTIRTEASPFFDVFRQNGAKLSNEKTFDEGIDHWRSLFRNDSIIEMNDRVFEGSNEIDAYFEMHKSTFRRIQIDVVGENVVESSDGIL